MYNPQDDTEHKRAVLADLVHTMKGMSAKSVLPREDDQHDDMNEDKENSKPYYRARSSADNEEVHDDKKDPASPKESLKKSKPEHSNMSDSEATRDEHGGNAYESANEESDEPSTPRSDRKDSMHDDSYSSPNAHEASHEPSQHDAHGATEFGEDESPEDSAEEETPMHPGLAKLLAEHMKRK